MDVQTPQAPTPQPYLVPVKPRWSRRIQISGVSGSASTSWNSPLIRSRCRVTSPSVAASTLFWTRYRWPVDGVRFGVLGPLLVTHGQRDVHISAGQPRQVLVLLLLHAGQTVSVDHLMSTLWDGDPPAS